MSKVSINFNDNFYSLQLSNINSIFNYNILYIINLNYPYNYKRMMDVKDIESFKNYLIFTCEFRENNDILISLKKNLGLKYVNYCFECFWCFCKYGNLEYENIDLGNDFFELDSNFFQENEDEIELSKYKNQLDSYKKTIFTKSISDVFSEYENIIVALSNLKKETEQRELRLEKMSNINVDTDYFYDRENELQKTRKLFYHNQELKSKISETQTEYENLKKKYDDIETKYNNLKNSNKFLNLPITVTEDKIWREMAVVIHLFDISLWDEIIGFVNNLDGFNLNIDLYVNISVNNKSLLDTTVYKKLVEKINKETLFQNIYITQSNNCGMDIGGFFISYCKMLDMGLRYHNIIKIHSKTNKNWRYAMLYALLGTKKIIQKNLRSINIPEVGMIGNEKLSLNYVLAVNKRSYKYLYTYQKYFGINKLDNYGYFIPGTIFWIKGEILDSFFTKQLLVKCYDEFEPNYCGSIINNREGKPHAFERFFGVLVKEAGKKVITYDTKF